MSSPHPSTSLTLALMLSLPMASCLPGAGGDGGGCHVEEQKDRTVLVSCEDGSSEILHHGHSCIKEPIQTSEGSGVRLTCPDDPDNPIILLNGANGEDGKDGTNGEDGRAGSPGSACEIKQSWLKVGTDIIYGNKYLVCQNDAVLLGYGQCPKEEKFDPVLGDSCANIGLKIDSLDSEGSAFSCILDGEVQTDYRVRICSI